MAITDAAPNQAPCTRSADVDDMSTHLADDAVDHVHAKSI